LQLSGWAARRDGERDEISIDTKELKQNTYKLDGLLGVTASCLQADNVGTRSNSNAAVQWTGLTS
jgi:hypothetical protein